MSQDFGTLVKSNKTDLKYLEQSDERMRFNNAGDPIYYVFECMDSRPMGVIAGEFVKDTFFEIARFVSKAVR